VGCDLVVPGSSGRGLRGSVEEGKEVGKGGGVGEEGNERVRRPQMIGSMSYTLDRPFVGRCGGTAVAVAAQ